MAFAGQPEFYNDEMAGIADPFITDDWDCISQTGGDWYALALSASLGGKTVHGMPHAPTMEVIQKTDEAFAKTHVIGRIQYADAEIAIPKAGSAWDERPSSGKSYRGVITADNTSMLFDTNEWQPSLRTRAKNIALLGACMNLAGTTLEDTVEICSAIAGEEVVTEAIIHASIPMSFVKREAAGAMKGSHALFSRGTAQKRITWEDSRMRGELFPGDAAIDWARVTTIARFIAEINIRVDSRFRDYARDRGVPFVMVKRSWATVSQSDYVYDAEKFEDIPRKEKGMINSVSLESAYTGHDLDMYAHLNALANSGFSDDAPLSRDLFLQMAASVKRYSEKSVDLPNTDVLIGVRSHKYGAEQAADKVKDSGTSWEALKAAFVEYVRKDKALKRDAAAIAESVTEHDVERASAAKVVSVVLSGEVWIRAVSILADILGHGSLARERLGKLKRRMTRSSATLESNVRVNHIIVADVYAHAKKLCKAVFYDKTPVLPPLVGFKDFISAENVADRRRVLTYTNDHWMKYRRAWADRYEGKSRAYALISGKEGKRQSVLYGTAAKAFRSLTATGLLNASKGFFDEGAGAKHYLYQAALAYVRKRHLDPLAGVPRAIGSSKELAAYLDKMLKPELTFADTEAFCDAKLQLFAADLMGEEDPSPDVDRELPAQAVAARTIDLAALTAFMRQPPPVRVTVQTVLSTYADIGQANTFARAAGYESFAAAFKELGEGARYDEESEYIKKANLVIHAEPEAEVFDERVL